MKVKCISKEPQQDKNNGKWYLPNEEYEVSKERGKELIDTKLFIEVKEPKEANKEKKQVNMD